MPWYPSAVGGSTGGGSSPGGGGGGGPHTHSLSGRTIEVLFDNTGDTDTALTVASGTPNWARSIDLPFSRALVEDDDDRDIRMRLRFTQDGDIKSFSYTLDADEFRLLQVHANTSGTVVPNASIIKIGSDGRSARTTLSLFARLNIFARNRTTDGEDIMRILFSLSGNSSAAITEFRATVELRPSFEALSVRTGGGGADSSGGGNGLDPVSWADADDPDEDSIGRIENIEGVLYEHDVKHHDGHGKTVRWGVLGHDRFLGSFERSSDVNNPQQGDFFVSRTFGDFEIYQNSRWVSYNPFGDGGVWDDSASLTYDDGVAGTIDDPAMIGIVLSRVEAFNRATGDGNVFWNRGARELIVATEFEAAADGTTDYFRRVYVAPAFLGPPTGIWWGVSQTERWPSNYPNTDPGTADSTRVRFVGGEPDEEFNSGTDVIGDIFVAVADISANIDVGVPALTNTMVFTLPPGRFNLFFSIGRSDRATDQQFSYALRRVTTGDDDVVLGQGGYWSRGTDSLENVGTGHQQLMIPNLVLDGTEQLYYSAIDLDNADLRSYMQIEKVG